MPKTSRKRWFRAGSKVMADPTRDPGATQTQRTISRLRSGRARCRSRRTPCRSQMALACRSARGVIRSTHDAHGSARRSEPMAANSGITAMRQSGQVGSKQPCLLRRHGERRQTSSQRSNLIIALAPSRAPRRRARSEASNSAVRILPSPRPSPEA
jgi:hypothetical protein